MCGRYSLTTAPEALRQLFAFENLPNLAPRYNIAPTQLAPVVRRRDDHPGRELVLLRWGLIPSWSKDATGAAKMINARSETAAAKPAFRDAFRRRRCLVPADGFYEWRTEEGRKQPFRIGFKGGGAFAFAGLWERWTVREGPEAGSMVESYTVLTTDANEKLRPIHDRMPVILAPESHADWLDPGLAPDAAQALLRPHPPEAMAFYRVSLRVNSVRNDDPGCIEPLARAAAAT